MNLPETWFYRHDEIVTNRPYAFDIDDDDWLWEGCGHGRIVGHNLRTNAVRIVPVREMEGHVVYQAFWWQGRLLMVLGSNVPHYLVLDVDTEECTAHAIPAEVPTIWYGVKTPQDKLLLYERSDSNVLVLDSPEAAPRIVPCPYQGHIAGGTVLSDGLVYSSLTDPGRIVRFDPEAERFVDEIPVPQTEATISTKFEHDGVVYCADSSRGRLLALELDTLTWREPTPVPGHGVDFGFIGGGFSRKGKAYFCLSTYRFSSRLDTKTSKIIVPEGGHVGTDGFAPRFMEKMLVFDGATETFDYLEAPEQPDGIPLLCYNWTDGERFVITGIVIPFAKPGEPGTQRGPWVVIQSTPADEEPALGPYDFGWNRSDHVRKYGRAYGRGRSLYLPSSPHTPPIPNMSGPAVQYSPGVYAEFARRAAKTDAAAYWQDLADRLLAGTETDAERVRRTLKFVHHALYYNPIQEPLGRDPIAILELHDARCGYGVAVTLAILKAAGIECRSVGLNHHVVGEAFCDGSWRLADALCFGEHHPERDGRVLSIDEIREDPYYADAWPIASFAYDPESMMSEDGFQVLGYVFGPWGSEPYYSYYHYGEFDCPPTMPTGLPAQRASATAVWLRWTESIKMGGGEVEYDVRVFPDRACKEELFRGTTTDTRLRYEVPEEMRMYFVEIRAVDDHRRKNPNTWYPAARWNFVLAPEGQYGWYGVM